MTRTFWLRSSTSAPGEARPFPNLVCEAAARRRLARKLAALREGKRSPAGGRATSVGDPRMEVGMPHPTSPSRPGNT